MIVMMKFTKKKFLKHYYTASFYLSYILTIRAIYTQI